jgi:GNAT acetyltransferase-like protein
MSPTLHTARLVLTPVGDHDLAPLHAHWNDPQVAHWLWDANPVPLQTVADLIAHSTQTFRTAAWGLWAIRPATAAPLVGACGLSAFEPSPGIELLYSLAPTHWSKGLASPRSWPPPTTPTRPPSTSSPASAPRQPPESRSALTPTPASASAAHTDPGMLLPGPCSSMDRATDF